MSDGYKSNLSTIRERINATYEKLDPKKIMRNNSRIRGAAPPSSWRDAHGKPVKYPKPNPVKYPKPNPTRRSRKCRRKKRRKTKRNLAGCACRDYRNCDCRRRARIEMELRRLREQREQAEREERLRQENLRILDDAKQYNLKDEDGNDFTIENLEDAKIALNKYLEDEKNHKRFIQALKNERVLIEDVGVPMGIPVPTTRWQRFKNFIKRKTRKVHPVSIVPESGKRKTRRKKRRKKRRKRKKNLAGSTCNRFANDCHGCLALRVPSSNIPWHRALGVRPGKDKTCLFNLDTGACRQPNIAAGRSHGRNDWTRNVDHCTVDAIAEGDDVVEIVEPELVRQTTDEGTPFAYPIGPGEGDNLPTAQVESPGPRRSICDEFGENCTIMGGRNSRNRKRKNKKTKKKRRRRR